jgi:hypothetical protein
VISDLEADRNAGEGTVFPLLAAKLENLKDSLRSATNTQMFSDGTGNGSKDITGLAALVSATPTLGTVEAISRVNFSFWRNQQTSGAKTLSVFDNLRAAMRSIYNLCSNGVGDAHPSFLVTDRATFEGYEGLLLAGERFTDKSIGDGGFENDTLKFKGASISYDVACGAGLLYELNPKFIKLVYKKGSWMKMQDAIRPANQTIDTYIVRSMCQMVVTNSRRCGVVTAIT